MSIIRLLKRYDFILSTKKLYTHNFPVDKHDELTKFITTNAHELSTAAWNEPTIECKLHKYHAFKLFTPKTIILATINGLTTIVRTICLVSTRIYEYAIFLANES